MCYLSSLEQWLGFSCTSIFVHLYCLQMNSSNNSIGFLYNGTYSLRDLFVIITANRVFIHVLPLVFGAVAWVFLYQHFRTSPLSSNELFKQLSWLSILWHRRFKLATLTFKALHYSCLPYLSDLLQHHESTMSLCSSSPHQLSVFCYNLTAPRVWNSPVSISQSQSLPTFRGHLKTFYFQSAYPLLAAHLA